MTPKIQISGFYFWACLSLSASVLPQQYSLFSAVRYDLKADSRLVSESNLILAKQVGVKEKTGSNDGVQVERYLKSIGLNKGQPYCAAGQYYCYSEAAKRLGIDSKEIPAPKSGLARAFYWFGKKHGSKSKTNTIHKHSFMIWGYTNSNSGHIERVVSVGKLGWVKTIGFNTSNGLKGSQREGNGVFFRKRNVFHPLSKMALIAIINVIPRIRGQPEKCDLYSRKNI